MKIVITIFIFLLTGHKMLSAQGLEVFGGVAFNNLYVGSGVTAYYPGFFTGMNYTFNLGKNIFLKPGLRYSLKNLELNENTNRFSVNYISLPARIVFKPSLGRVNMDFGFGPYVAYGFNKNLGSKITIDPGSPGRTPYNLKSVDYGFTFFTGPRFWNKLRVSVSFDVGLRNINNSSTERITTGGFGVDVGYRLQRK